MNGVIPRASLLWHKCQRLQTDRLSSDEKAPTSNDAKPFLINYLACEKEPYLAERSSRRWGLSTTLSHISFRIRCALAFLSLDSTTDDSFEGPAKSGQLNNVLMSCTNNHWTIHLTLSSMSTWYGGGTRSLAGPSGGSGEWPHSRG